MASDTDSARPSGTRRESLAGFFDPATLLLAVLLLVFAVQSWGFARSNAQGDFYQFWAVGALTATSKDIYTDQARTDLARVLQYRAHLQGASPREGAAVRWWPTLQTTGTPFFYVLFGYLQLGNYDADSAVFSLLSLIVFIAAITWIARFVGLSRITTMLIAAFVMAASFPFNQDLFAGNVNQLQVGILAGYLALRATPLTDRRSLAAGALMGLAVLFKPNLAFIVVLLVLYALLERRWRDLALQGGGFVVAALLGVAITFVRFGSLEPWMLWWRTFNHLTMEIGYSLTYTNYSLDRLIRETTGIELTYVLFGLLMSVIAGVLVLRIRRDGFGASPHSAEDRWGTEFLLVGAGVAITLLASPLSWAHYYLLLVPIVIFMLRPADSRFPSAIPTSARWAVAVVSLLLMAFKQMYVLHSNSEALPFLAAYAGAAILIFTACLFEVGRPTWLSRSPTRSYVSYREYPRRV